MKTCERCDGKGWSGPVHVSGGNGRSGWLDRVDCYQCGGAGKISDEQAAAISIGRLHMVERTDRGESLATCSRRLGISPAALCDYEHGRTFAKGYEAAKAAINR